MKDYKNKSLGDTISTIGSMLLFLLFAGCLLMMIATAAGTYTRISTGFDKTFGSTAALRYVSNKVKSSHGAEIAENGSAIYLDNDEITDVIYYRNGGLYEKAVSSSETPSVGGGNKLFDLSDMKITEQGNLLKITILHNGEHNSTYIRRG